jgi:ABC-type multidrug transport system ATPase subunit
VIEVTNVTKRFHSLVAIDNVTLQVRRGEVIGLLGPNGAGKTTLFKLIAGLLNPDAGELQPVSGRWPSIGYKPERLLFPGNMRVRQYLRMVGNLCEVPSSGLPEMVDDYLARVNLAYAADKKIKDCSKGMRQRLALAQALIGEPALLLLDEPSNGLDPEGQEEICRQIKALHAEGKTILLASHHLHEVTQVCTYLVILNQGTIHYENTMANALAERPHSTIFVDRSLGPLQTVLQSLHPDIVVSDSQVVLNNEAVVLRRQVLSILLSGGYDIARIEQSRVTLAEIYAGAIQ